VSLFSEAELSYLAERRLGRLSTIGPDGQPRVVPLGWSYDREPTVSTEAKTQPVPSLLPNTSADRTADAGGAIGAAVTVWLLARFATAATVLSLSTPFTGHGTTVTQRLASPACTSPSQPC
jgi:hypothetical protein